MESLSQGMRRQPWLQCLMGLYRSHTCSRIAEAGQSVPRLWAGSPWPVLLVWAACVGAAGFSSLTGCRVRAPAAALRTAGPGSPEPSSHNSSHQLELDWENSHLSQRVNALLSRGDWKPLPGHLCSLEVKVLLCTSSHLQ